MVFMDCVYYSFITYTTLGFGDVIPTGTLRFLTSLESLTGHGFNYMNCIFYIYRDAEILEPSIVRYLSETL